MKTVLDVVKEGQPDEPELSFDRSDIERRMGLPAGRFTNPGPLLTPLVGVVVTVAFYGILALVSTSAVAAMFTRSVVISAAIVFLTVWSLASLVVKERKLALQRRALSLRILPTEDPGFILTPQSAENVLQTIFASVDDPRQFFLTRRIHHALANLRNIGRIADVDEVLSTQADNDEAQIDSSYTVLRGIIWAVPVLGFIGTVLGLSLAMGSFGSVLTAADDTGALVDALQSVVGGLATAFETTLQGLVAALCIHLLMIRQRRREEQFLDDCKEYCQTFVVGRLRLSGQGAES